MPTTRCKCPNSDTLQMISFTSGEKADMIWRRSCSSRAFKNSWCRHWSCFTQPGPIQRSWNQTVGRSCLAHADHGQRSAQIRPWNNPKDNNYTHIPFQPNLKHFQNFRFSVWFSFSGSATTHQGHSFWPCSWMLLRMLILLTGSSWFSFYGSFS